MESVAEDVPFGVLLPAACAGGALVVLAATLVAGARDFDKLAWVFLGGLWLSQSQIRRCWRRVRSGRTWLPASLFAFAAAGGGLLIAAMDVVPGDRRVAVIYTGLVAGFFGGDLLDWSWKRLQDRTNQTRRDTSTGAASR